MCEQQQRAVLQILYDLHIGSSLNLVNVYLGIVLNPAKMLVGQHIELDLNIVLILEAEGQNLKLKHTYNADDDLLHTGVVLLEDLDGTLLGDLGNALKELLTLHGVHLTDSCEVLRCEGRDSFISKLLI